MMQRNIFLYIMYLSFYWIRIALISFIIASVGSFVLYVWCTLCNRKEEEMEEEIFEIL